MARVDRDFRWHYQILPQPNAVILTVLCHLLHAGARCVSPPRTLIQLPLVIHRPVYPMIFSIHLRGEGALGSAEIRSWSMMRQITDQKRDPVNTM